MLRLLWAACLLLGGCALLPMPPPADPGLAGAAVHCEPRPAVGGLLLECGPAVAAAVEALAPLTRPIETVTFDYGPCRESNLDVPGQHALADCAIQMSGTVRIKLAGVDEVATFLVERTEHGVVVATRQTEQPEP